MRSLLLPRLPCDGGKDTQSQMPLLPPPGTSAGHYVTMAPVPVGAVAPASRRFDATPRGAAGHGVFGFAERMEEITRPPAGGGVSSGGSGRSDPGARTCRLRRRYCRFGSARILRPTVAAARSPRGGGGGGGGSRRRRAGGRPLCEGAAELAARIARTMRFPAPLSSHLHACRRVQAG